MLDLTFCSLATVPGAKTTAYNLLGEALLLNRTQGNVNQTGPVTISINNVAKIVDADIMGTNGVLHVIDTILPTESALPMTSLMAQKNLTIFQRLLEASGYDNQFDDLDNVTIFAPTDKALQNSEWARMLKEQPELLNQNLDLLEFLNYHVVKPMIKTCELSEKSLPTVAGASVRLNLYSTHALFSDVMNRATVNCARLVHFDDESCGSVLHQVDRPLSPPKNVSTSIVSVSGMVNIIQYALLSLVEHAETPGGQPQLQQVPGAGAQGQSHPAAVQRLPQLDPAGPQERCLRGVDRVR